MNKKRCMSCMKLIDSEVKVCPHCGFQEEYYQVEFYHLPVGHTLQDGRYQIGRVIGEGGFGLTYIGWDGKFGQVVAIKEFYSKEMVSRDNTVSYRVRLYKQSDDEKYRQDLKRVEREARTLKQFSGHPGIVGVEDFFEENNTIYIVMEYIEGRTLEQYRQQTGGRIEEAKCLAMFQQLLRSLHSIHKEGVVHRDISMTNIMVRQDESLVLVDFGSARPMDQQSVGITVKLGYAPLEQYMPDKDNQGPWLDVYTISVCLYNCLTGKPLPDSKLRNQEDIWADVGTDIKVSKNLKNVLKKGLELDYKKRYRSVSELYEGLYGESLDSPSPPDPRKPGKEDRKNTWKNRIQKNKKQILIVCGVVAVLTAGGVTWRSIKNSLGSALKTGDLASETTAESEITVDSDSTTVSQTGVEVETAGAEEWTDQEGNHYTGIRKNGFLEGEGTCVYANGETYTGQWMKGKPDGNGTKAYTNGNRYEGEFKDGVKEGIGTFYWADGEHYEGNFKNDVREGEGTMYYASGNRYEGQWVNGQKEGTGTYYFTDGGRYEGQWVNGQKEGTGTDYYADGNRYEGQWVNGQKEGIGTYYWKGGDRYEGQWEDGQREGEGIYYFSEDGEFAGCRREGVYKDNKLEGEATFYWADGTAVSEQWENDKKIK